MSGAAAAPAESAGGRKVGDLAAVNAQENRKKDVVSISLHGWLCHDFFAPSLSPPLSLSHSSPLLLHLPLSCLSLPGEAENPRPITWATFLGSFVVHHHKDPVHPECRTFIHNLLIHPWLFFMRKNQLYLIQRNIDLVPLSVSDYSLAWVDSHFLECQKPFSTSVFPLLCKIPYSTVALFANGKNNVAATPCIMCPPHHSLQAQGNRYQAVFM